MRRSSRLMLFGLAALLLAASILYSRATRHVYLTDALRFVPKESEVVLVTGDIASLWKAVDDHFGETIREPEGDEQGGLAQLVTAWRESFEEQGVPIRTLADLERYGIEVGHGVIASLDEISTESGPLVVVDVDDRDAFSRFFISLFDAEERSAVSIAGTKMPVVEGAEAMLAFPEPGTATVLLGSEDPLILQRGLSDTRRNLTHARENDALYEGVRRSLGRPLASGPVLYAYWRPRAYTPVEQVIAVARLGDRTIGIDADVTIEGGGLRTLDALETPAGDAVAWTRHLPPTTAAAVLLVDPMASDYLNLAAVSEDLRGSMEGAYGGIVGELRRVSSLERLLFAWTGYRDGLPEWVVGIWAGREALDDLVDELQVKRRTERDRIVLEAAIEAYRQERGDTATPELEDLIASGFLLPEPHALFDRYPIAEGVVNPAALTAADLDPATYRRSHEGLTFEYLLPPVTENDLRHVPGLADQDAELVRQDRYRLAALVLDDVLWVASDSRELEDLVERSRGGLPGLSDSAAFATAETTWHGREKIRGFIDIDRLTVLGLLSPESQIEEQVKTVLLDLRNHPVLAFDLDPEESEGRVSVSVRLFHRSAMVPK